MGDDRSRDAERPLPLAERKTVLYETLEPAVPERCAAPRLGGTINSAESPNRVPEKLEPRPSVVPANLIPNGSYSIVRNRSPVPRAMFAEGSNEPPKGASTIANRSRRPVGHH